MIGGPHTQVPFELLVTTSLDLWRQCLEREWEEGERVGVCALPPSAKLALFHLTRSHKEPKKPAGAHALQASELVVTYFFCGEEIPYRRMLKAQSLTLGHFKEQLSKKGNYR